MPTLGSHPVLTARAGQLCERTSPLLHTSSISCCCANEIYGLARMLTPTARAAPAAQILYLMLVQFMDSRGGELLPPPPEAFEYM